ncbi:hypothetical protein GJ631_03515 [Natronomonas sp. CBA1123]|jgi:hypothetical protein|uniref:DUF7504 family protein n=1 Tax=Natronomonas sp. CBA1123 TaxID=2668070 RepID=UPI0012E9F3EE|nr:hypothetical protein [Natronomonas sp. CBA1123]MUV85669.1 hypothetical protein [Natronomonas sp. CBA1123]
MSESLLQRVPEDASTVLVRSPAIEGVTPVCAGLSERSERVLLVGYAGSNVESLRTRLAERSTDPPPVRELDVGTDVEPSDLTGLGIAVAESLRPDTAVCFDSLTAMLQYADRERAFQFLHALGERCASAEATAHFHLDPEAADETTTAALSTLVDVVVDTEDETVSVRPELTEKD